MEEFSLDVEEEPLIIKVPVDDPPVLDRRGGSKVVLTSWKKACCLCPLILAAFFLTISICSRVSKQAELLDLVEMIQTTSLNNHTTGSLMLKESSSNPLTQLEQNLIQTLYRQALAQNSSLLIEMLKGAHIVLLNDHGKYYRQLQQLGSYVYRMSSHYSSTMTFAISPRHVLQTVLIGETKDQSTWFQLEGSVWDPFHHPIESICHLVDYLEYKVRRVQIGPFGTSIYTESHPLLIDLSNSSQSILTNTII